MWNKIIHWVIMPCNEITFEIEKKNAKKISLIQNLRLNLHIYSCKWCASYYKKVKLIDNLLNKQNSKEKLINVDDLKSKIKSKIETHCKHK